jgi:hypothetical protein
MKSIDLSGMESLNDSEEELAEYELGEIVSVDKGSGIIAAVLTGEFGWPGNPDDVDEDSDYVTGTEEDEIKMQASEDEPLYVVALEEGGSVLAESDEISTDASLDSDSARIESWEDMGEDAESAELADIYSQCENPSNRTEWQHERARMVRERNSEAIARYVEGAGGSVDELSQRSAEELLNIPGVDDPGVGFDSDPNGWDRTSYLDAWATVGGMWRTCYARMIRHFGPNMAKRWCAALKDEILQTEEWRGDF